MIDVGIIGCGRVADQHAVQIARIKGARLAAVCDSEPLMARQLAERYHLKDHFTDPQAMLAAVGPGVVHITTPPQSHFALAKLCLSAGSNVYIEKPFTLTTDEARELIDLAISKGLKITAGHNAQFTHAMIRMRQLVKDGYLGGKPVHVECVYCYTFGDESYAKAMLGDRDHWTRSLPGSLLQNIISHGISKIAEFLDCDEPLVIAQGFTSPFLKSIGQDDIIDEVRVIIRGDNSPTAYFTFSSQIAPPPHQLRIYGPKGSLIVDDDHQVVIKIGNRDYKSYLRYFFPPLGYAGQYFKAGLANMRDFVRGTFHLPFDSGLKTLIEAFYAAVANGSPVPISYREIILTSKIMDDIFEQVRNQKMPADASPP